MYNFIRQYVKGSLTVVTKASKDTGTQTFTNHHQIKTFTFRDRESEVVLLRNVIVKAKNVNN